MPRSPADMLWADAVNRLARIDRLHQDSFRPVPKGWEPPIDLLETNEAIIVVAALPGVAASDLDIVFGNGEVTVVGQRRIPTGLRGALVHRMELPYGRFERSVPLPPGRYELANKDVMDGCLTLVLRKI